MRKTERGCFPITRKNGDLASIGDILMDREQVFLTARITGVLHEDRVREIIKTLLLDLDPHLHHPSDEYSHSWKLKISEFCKLTNLFKSRLVGVTIASMKMLLLQTRRDIANRRNTDRKKFHRLQRSLRLINGRVPIGQNIPTAISDRLTPLESSFYRSFMEVTMRKRLGPKAANTIHMAMEHTSWWDFYVRPVITNKGIAFINKDGEITRENYKTYIKEKIQ